MKISDLILDGRTPTKAIGKAKPGSGAGLQVHTPVPREFRENLRIKVFERLARAAVAKAEQVKGAQLTRAEVQVVMGKLQEELEKRDFFYVG